MSERILVAMSGGVDSSVAAARLKSEGYDVVGVTLHLWDYPDDGSVKSRCCAPEDIHDARRVCDTLGIPHFAFDRRELFAREVVDPFVEDYLTGSTPSPCVRCNRGVKIRELLAIADKLGARRVATGHYARIEFAESEAGAVPRLLRARDLSKDQSYFLHMLDASSLQRLCFPLGELTKAEVRAQAVALALPGATKGESQELCFIPTGRYDAFVEERAGDRIRPGNILNEHGQVVASHEGIHRFTVGQRRNLGVAVGKRAYVVEVGAADASVRLGSREDLLSDRARLTEFTLAADCALPLECEVAVRYRGQPHAAQVRRVAGAVEVLFAEPVAAVVPGQFAVLYAGDRVLGGGLIVPSVDSRRALASVDASPPDSGSGLWSPA
jgi:tRNA-uridine 2-sulfurtransferase